jgi:hypothetical protein
MKKTTQVSQEEKIPVYNLLNWIRHGVIPRPAKDSSGHWVWFAADVAAARRVWEQRRPRKPQQPANHN